jgi:hypothetical protein
MVLHFLLSLIKRRWSSWLLKALLCQVLMHHCQKEQTQQEALLGVTIVEVEFVLLVDFHLSRVLVLINEALI